MGVVAISVDVLGSGLRFAWGFGRETGAGDAIIFRSFWQLRSRRRSGMGWEDKAARHSDIPTWAGTEKVSSARKRTPTWAKLGTLVK